MFGSLSVEIDGTRLGPRDLGGVKTKQVFELLVSARGHHLPKERIADLLWGESLPKNVAATLETYVSILRSRLGAAGRHLIVTESEAYRVDCDMLALDLDRFDELMERSVQGRPSHRLRHLQDALDLARGEVLEDEPYSTWADELRQHYRQQVMRARLDATGLSLLEGNPRGALAHAQAALGLDPLDERAHRWVILSQYASGAHQGALHAYERCCTALNEELGADPDPETEDLVAAIRERRPPEELVAAAVQSPPLTVAPRRPVSAMLGREEMRMLLVEDSPVDARIISDALDVGMVPVRLTVVEDGDAAVSILRRIEPYEEAITPDLVLLDLNLPGRSGQEVLAEIKSDPELRRIPVVVLTASAADADITQSYDLHANSYVTKPVDPADFFEVVQAIETFWPVTASPPKPPRNRSAATSIQG
jgi:DNA-binding SARP family transcriptional activator/AmiR/NasT family two-component response regulator